MRRGGDRWARVAGLALGWVFGIAALAGGCGSRSALDVPVGPDAGSAPASFPCRWSMGPPILLRRDASFLPLRGAVHPTLNLALVTGSAPGTDPRPFFVTQIVGEGALVAEAFMHLVASPPERLFAGTTHFLQQAGPDCVFLEIDEAGTVAAVLRLATPSRIRCRVWQHALGRLDAVVVSDTGPTRRVYRVTLEPDGPPRVDETRMPLDRAASIEYVLHEPAAGTIVVYADGHVWISTTAGAIEEHDLLMGPGGLSAAADRAHGGVVILHASPSGGWRLSRVPFAAPIRVLDLDGLAASPIGALASNETEALIPLADGSMAFIPLAAPSLQIVDPADVDRVHAMEIILRPGQSAGGALFVRPDEAGASALMFRTLTCNR